MWWVLDVSLVLVVASNTVLTDEGETDIRLVHAVFRHGPRTPADTYPNDPYVNFTFWPFGWGQLTNDGKMAQYLQGQFLRTRYNDLLGDHYSPSLVEVQTTGVDRTIMSAQLEMAGMWPPSPEQKWNPDLNWQPTVIRSTPLNQDRLLLVRIPCPRYYQELESVLNSSEVQDRLKELNADSLYEELTNYTGMLINSPEDVQSLYGTLNAENDFNLTLPEWAQKYYPDKLVPLTELSYELNARTPVLKTIKGGPLLKNIIQNSRNKIDGNNKQVLYMYGGHDSTVTNLLLTLGVWDSQVPAYGIMALFEVHQKRGSEEYGIKIFLRNSTSHEPYPLTIPGCDHFCPMSQFVELTKDVIPDDLDSFCEVDDPNYVPPPPPPP